MIIGISIDISQLNECYDLITQNLDVINHIQIYLDDRPLYLQKEEILKFQKIFSSEHLTYSLHGYGYINLCENIVEIRKSWLDIACKTIFLAQETSCIFVNYHMGYTFTKSATRKMLLENLCESLEVLSKYAQESLIEINIENDFNTTEFQRLGSQVEDLDLIISRNYPHLKLCYDIGHANIAFACPYEYRKYIKFIQSLHIHNNWGNDDVHNPFGNSGSIDLDYVLTELINNDVFFILENELNMYNIALKNIRNSLSIINIKRKE